MYKINDYLLYKRQVCIVKEIKKKLFNDKDYYIITPLDDESLTISVPTDSPVIRDILTKEEADDIISKIADIKPLSNKDKSLENIYKELLSTEDELDLVKIIKTTYLRNKKRVDNGQKIGDKDDAYFKKAEKLLYTSLGTSLGMSYDECKDYVVKIVEESKKKHV